MTRRLQTVIYDVDPDPKIEAAHLGFALDDTADRFCIFRTKKISRLISRTHRYQMRALSGGGYTPDTPVVITQAAHGGDLVREWAAIELMYEETTTDTTVEARLHDGLGTSFYWTGAAWAVATLTAHWNDPADVVANFATMAVTGATGSVRLGVEWRIDSSDRLVTPYVYGAYMAARLLFGARSGSTAQDTRSDSWLDDIIHRVAIPWFKSSLAPEVTDELVAIDEVTVLDYSDGINFGEGNYVVNEVQAVHDLDDDAEMFSPLSGTWDPSEKTFTLDVALPSSTRYAARLTYDPIVAYTGNKDFKSAALPQLLIERIDQVKDRGTDGDLVVRDTANLTALRLPFPRWKEYRLLMLLQSDGAMTAMELAGAIERAFNGRRGVRLLSGGTGMPVSIHGNVELRPARGDTEVAAAARFDLTLWSREYHGVEESGVPLLKTDGFVTTIVPAESVVAR